MNDNLIAVATADIVNSTALDKEHYVNAIALITKLLNDAKTKYGVNYEIYRGDGFQVVYPDPVNALSSVLAIKLALKSGRDIPSISITQSLAVGSYEHLSSYAGQSSGEVFVNSGRGLEATKGGDVSIHLSDDFGANDLLLSTRFLNHLLNSISQKQATVGYLYLDQDYPEQNMIAQQLNMTRQNVATHLKRGAFDLIKAYIQTYEELTRHAKENGQ